MPTIKIEGTGEQFEQTESQDCILRAGLTAGYGLAYECNSGGCGTCKFQLIEGEIEEPWPTAPALSARDIKKGRKLACQCKAKTDLVIKMRTDPEYAPINLPARFEATLSSRRDVTSDIVEFCFQAPDSADAKFLPGQYAMLTFPDGRGPRAYSMSNLPNGDGVWEFWIRRKPGGEVSGALFDELRVGGRIVVDGPYGHAYLRAESERDILCIAGGSGISPMLSIARGVLMDPDMEGRQVHFYFGGRTPDDLCGLDELKVLPGFQERVHYHPAISMPEESPEWTGDTGFIHEIVENQLGNELSRFECYLAGPPPMVQATTKMLQLQGNVPTGQIHYDPFY
ncbi:FAD-binding oxidoreductase [Marinobacter sp. TBZ242]|uniref:FAD-binding oxidoreductase n=1 Tax=Marinobacter azerbaijanicus TaxID=3050455 RepID=A0ABT7IHP1_9GAMM|nr:FAD-binding oxidoreductase [Marinobacter sp. TBZ242]MDL0433198.1 FAD-binding oxidoreductase [Marinobacter sp. TBZ242]